MENKLTFVADNGHHDAARKVHLEMALFVPAKCEWLEKVGAVVTTKTEDEEKKNDDEILT